MSELISAGYNLRPVYSFLFSPGLLPANPLEMKVDGSITPVVFTYPSILAPITNTVAIKEIQIIIGDGGAFSFANFGGLAALANGVLIQYNDAFQGAVTIANFQNNQDIIRLCNENSLLRLDGGDVALIATVNFRANSTGLIFEPNTANGLTITIRDNLTALTSFTVKVIGHELP